MAEYCISFATIRAEANKTGSKHAVTTDLWSGPKPGMRNAHLITLSVCM